MKNFKRGGAGLLFTGDVAFFMAALFVTLIVRYQDIPTGTLLSQHIGPFALMMIIWVVVFFVIGLYDRYILFTRKELVGTIIRAQIINTAIAIVFFFMLPLGITPKTNLAIYLVVSIGLISLWRLYLFPLLFAARPIRALIIGTGDEARQVRAVLEHNPFFQQVAVNYIDTAKYNNESLIEDALSVYAAEHSIDIIIADLNESLSQKLTPFFFNLTFLERRVTFFSLTDFFEQLHHRIPPSLIGESWLLQNVTADSPHYAYDVIKRIIDTVGAVVLLFPCLIIFPLVIIALKVQDGGAIFYRTTRVGQYNKPIQILKFRTMNGRDSGVEALKSKLYVTKFGMFMRKLRIDELPQLLNVLRGDLSFIGPRPEIPELAHVYAENIPYYNMRHFIKPGLSGWAQINNFDVPRQGVDVPRTIDKLSFDLYYLRHRSLLLDIEIALKTVNAVLSRTGT